jgi:hypothetical protein
MGEVCKAVDLNNLEAALQLSWHLAHLGCHVRDQRRSRRFGVGVLRPVVAEIYGLLLP